MKPEKMTKLNVSEQAKTVATIYRKQFMKLAKLPDDFKTNGTDFPWELISR